MHPPKYSLPHFISGVIEKRVGSEMGSGPNPNYVEK